MRSIDVLYLDCKSIVTWMKLERPRLSHTRCPSLLFAAIDLQRQTTVDIRHCPPHAERRMPRDQSSTADIGNYLADQAADRDLDEIRSF